MPLISAGIQLLIENGLLLLYRSLHVSEKGSGALCDHNFTGRGVL